MYTSESFRKKFLQNSRKCREIIHLLKAIHKYIKFRKGKYKEKTKINIILMYIHFQNEFILLKVINLIIEDNFVFHCYRG